ncbi:cell wall-binding repeat-containing protein [Ornithinimicrobium ciconiae]|nr:cell wall-binding repeat-containing protein [Ornithinimicrobium ciconiae]
MKRSAHGGRHLLAAVASAALAVSGLSAVAATAQETDTDQPSSEPAQIQEAVLTELTKSGEATFWVHFDARPDMSQFAHIADWDARGIAVYDALTSTADAAQADVRSELDGHGLSYETYWATNAILVEDADADVVQDIARAPGVEGIYGTFAYEAPETKPAESEHALNAVEWGVRDINADDAWSQGVTGEGIVVANLDSGVQWDHPALVNSYRGSSGGTVTHDYNWFDGTPDKEPAPWDWDGHGTHTMGTMVGNDGGSNQIGVAPGAQWMAASTDLTDASMFAAGEWFLAPTKVDGTDPDPTMRPHVINNSWGSELPSNDPFMEDIIESWHAAGTFSVFSNGNEGPGCATSGSPGSRILTYSVGSYDSFHSISGFSSRGPGQDGEVKPNISAPGSAVRSSFPGGQYGTISGTSMAAPHVSGAIALLWSENSTAAGDVAATRALLDGSAIDSEDLQCGGTAEKNNVFGEGRLDAYQLIFGDEPPVPGPAITVDPSSIENSQEADTTTEHTLTVGNTGTEDLEFTITEVEGSGAPVVALPQGADRSHASAETDGGPSAPAVVEAAEQLQAVASLTEGFDDVNTLPADGWAIKNNSEPVGATTWFQGNAAEVFPSHEGAPEAYVGANYNNAGASPGNISNWLMTPELDLVNGSEFSFWTRTVANPADFVDRMEVRLSTSGASTNVGTGYDGVGDFDTVLASVNPDLTATGYPGEWTEYTVSIEGLDEATTGRIGFHYWVPAGGPLGNNSNFIGVDTVSYEAVDAPPPVPACEVVDAAWLSVDPVAGTVAPGGSQEVTVGLDSAGLAEGEYTAALCVESNDPVNPVVNVPVTLTVTDDAPVEPALVQRISGENRYATAAEIAAEFPEGVDTVYIANGTEAADGADALAAGAAGAKGALEFIPDVTPEGDPAPILLVKNNQIPQATAGALAALDPAEIIIIGGTGSVSTGVEETLGESADVRRIAGADRYETAALIAAEYGSVETVYVATGQGDMDSGLALADALTAASLAGSEGSPVVLTRSGSLPAATAEVITELGVANIVVIGGTGAVSDDVLAQLNELAPTERVAGANRYETAVALTAGYGADADMLYIASGTNFPDALSGSSLTGSQSAPLLLTRQDHLPAAISEEILRLSPQGITIFGGTVAVNTDVEADLQALLDTTSTD